MSIGGVKPHTWSFGSQRVNRVSVVLAVGIILIAVGTVMIVGARHNHYVPIPDGPTIDKVFIYQAWDVLQLATGIILALVGTASVSSSLTYRVLSGKMKGV